jgi:hypothetical protein
MHFQFCHLSIDEIEPGAPAPGGFVQHGRLMTPGHPTTLSPFKTRYLLIFLLLDAVLRASDLPAAAAAALPGILLFTALR